MCYRLRVICVRDMICLLKTESVCEREIHGIHLCKYVCVCVCVCTFDVSTLLQPEAPCSQAICRSNPPEFFNHENTENNVLNASLFSLILPTDSHTSFLKLVSKLVSWRG